ncbi:phosphoglycerate kinase [Ferroplasma sp.]|uniref:phosphoglycerate kinase n=1 Tax=Ferroplasma sp. TaxID=2591003 RepID=UPI00307DB6C8
MGNFPFYTMDDFEFKGKRVYLRIDINSPLNPITGEIVDDSRFRHYLDTIHELNDSKVVIVAHQGRPGDSDFVSLKQHARHMGRLLGREVKFVDSMIGAQPERAIKEMKDGDIIMLENSRFYSEELLIKNIDAEQENTYIVKQLSKLFDYYIIDAFPAIHRAQTTLTGFQNAAPNIAGRLMENEIGNIEKFKNSKVHPKLAIMGGAKISDAIKASRPFLEKHIVDNIIYGGVAANIFLWASGIEIGKKNKEFIQKQDNNYKLLLAECKSLLSSYKDHIFLPEDFVLNPSLKEWKIDEDIPDNELLADIGLNSIKIFSKLIENAKNIFLNGPMGMYEINDYSFGTREIFNEISQATATKIVGGGHTVNAINEFGLSKSIGYISTGGGALINYLSGEPIPVIESLIKNREKFGGM